MLHNPMILWNIKAMIFICFIFCLIVFRNNLFKWLIFYLVRIIVPTDKVGRRHKMVSMCAFVRPSVCLSVCLYVCPLALSDHSNGHLSSLNLIQTWYTCTWLNLKNWFSFRLCWPKFDPSLWESTGQVHSSPVDSPRLKRADNAGFDVLNK